MPIISFPLKIDLIISICFGFNELGMFGYFYLTISCWYVQAVIVIGKNPQYTSGAAGEGFELSNKVWLQMTCYHTCIDSP